ncbi:sirtuin 1 [Pelomyxa schiedti]|nr:sirtuin 1 [Pelomyxa schiedti]
MTEGDEECSFLTENPTLQDLNTKLVKAKSAQQRLEIEYYGAEQTLSLWRQKTDQQRARLQTNIQYSRQNLFSLSSRVSSLRAKLDRGEYCGSQLDEAERKEEEAQMRISKLEEEFEELDRNPHTTELVREKESAFHRLEGAKSEVAALNTEFLRLRTKLLDDAKRFVSSPHGQHLFSQLGSISNTPMTMREKLKLAASLSVLQSNGISETDIAGIVEMLLPVYSQPHPKLSSLDIHGVADFIKSGHCKKIVILCGAGISVNAGIPDFRSPGTGLYSQLKELNLPFPEAIFDIEYYKKNPKPFCTQAKLLFPANRCFQPTKTHHFLRLLADKGVVQRIYTQNIDTLESVARVPAEKLVFAHGSLASAHCLGCGQEYSSDFVLGRYYADEIPVCDKCGGLVKPDIVFFGEPLPQRFVQLHEEDLKECDLLLILGTSLNVQPVSWLVSMVRYWVPRILINRTPVTEIQQNAEGNTRDVELIGDCDSITSQLVSELGWDSDLQNLILSNTTTSTSTATSAETTPTPVPQVPVSLPSHDP